MTQVFELWREKCAVLNYHMLLEVICYICVCMICVLCVLCDCVCTVYYVTVCIM